MADAHTKLSYLVVGVVTAVISALVMVVIQAYVPQHHPIAVKLTDEDFDRIRQLIGRLQETKPVARSESAQESRKNAVPLVTLKLLSAAPVQLQKTTNAPMFSGGIHPPTVLKTVSAGYTQEALQARWEGTVVLLVTIDREGNTSNIRVIRPAPFGLNAQAISAASHWKLIPARRNGLPYEAQMQVNMIFKLEEREEDPGDASSKDAHRES
jgi:TonB family protein